MLRRDYSALKGAQHVAVGMGRRYPANMEFVKAADKYGFERFKPLFGLNGLQRLKKGLRIGAEEKLQDNDAMRLNCARNQLQFIAFSLYLSKTLAAMARVEAGAKEVEFLWVRDYLQGAIKGRAVPFEIFSLDEFASEYVDANWSGSRLDGREMASAINLMGNMMMEAIKVRWDCTYKMIETHNTSYHAMVHAAFFIEKLLEKTIRLYDEGGKTRESG